MNLLCSTRKLRYASVVAVITGLAVAFSVAPSGGRMKRALFVAGVGRSAHEQAIKNAVRLYNSSVAGMYATGGTAPEVFASLPAFPLEKRRLFKDIKTLRDSNLLIVFDRDVEKVQSVVFEGPDRAVAISKETWVLMIQDFNTRKPLSNLKASVIQCRYLLYRHDGNWLLINIMTKVERCILRHQTTK